MSDTSTPKVAGTEPGELIRDLTDPRLLAAHPRPATMDDATYCAQLVAKGLAIHLPRERVAAGEYAGAKAKAILSGAVVVVPLDDNERPATAAPDDKAHEAAKSRALAAARAKT